MAHEVLISCSRCPFSQKVAASDLHLAGASRDIGFPVKFPGSFLLFIEHVASAEMGYKSVRLIVCFSYYESQ
jgi:hypothetical protein